jgi:hypothetical protein
MNQKYEEGDNDGTKFGRKTFAALPLALCSSRHLINPHGRLREGFIKSAL